MRWGVTIPGSPVSWDAAYRTGRMPVIRGKGIPVLDENGAQRYIHRPILTDEARRWRDDCQLLMQAACPSRFKPVGRLRVRWKFYLTRIIDSDNLVKLPSDALAKAIGYDDKFFNHCVEDVILVEDPREARVEVIIDTDPACRSSFLDEGRDPSWR